MFFSSKQIIYSYFNTELRIAFLPDDQLSLLRLIWGTVFDLYLSAVGLCWRRFDQRMELCRSEWTSCSKKSKPWRTMSTRRGEKLLFQLAHQHIEISDSSTEQMGIILWLTRAQASESWWSVSKSNKNTYVVLADIIYTKIYTMVFVRFWWFPGIPLYFLFHTCLNLYIGLWLILLLGVHTLWK